MNGHRRRQRASRPRRTIIISWLLLANAAALVASPGVARAQALPDPLPGTLSGTYAVNATSGSAVLTGNSTLEGTVTLDLRFLAEYLIVGGGGGGGPSNRASPGGGGGGGRVIFDNAFVINTPQTFTIEVGAGGQGGIGGDLTTGTAATSGGQSRFGDVIAAGGGRGGWGGLGTTTGTGAAGGSGGGAGRNPSPTTTAGGTAVGSLGLGSAGGTVISSTVSSLGGAGGGGATAAGSAPPGTGSGGGDGGNGGQGYASAILGTSDVFGSGGGGGAQGSGNPLVIAVNGVGGTNAGSGGGPGSSGVANRGGGGGGAQRAPSGALSTVGENGGAGGSGMVVVRYQGAPVAGSSGGVAGTGSAAGYTIHSYTSGSTSLDFTGLNLDQRLGATLSGNLSGTGSLSYAGPGRLTLTGTSSYSGSTTVTAGMFVVNGTLSDTSLVTVGAAGTLGGSGVIAAGVTAAGVVAPGNSIGTLTTDDFLLSGTLANELARFDDGSSILPVSDLVDVTGTVTLNDADLSLSLWTGSGYSQPILGDIFYLIANDGIDAISGVFTSLNGVPTTLAEGSEFSWNSQQWKITYQADYTGSYEGSSFTGGNDAAIIVVPEPTALAGAATGISLLGLFVRRFRRRSQRPSPHQIV